MEPVPQIREATPEQINKAFRLVVATAKRLADDAAMSGYSGITANQLALALSGYSKSGHKHQAGDVDLSALVITEEMVDQLVEHLAGKQPLDATLTALAALVTAANQVILCTGVDTFSVGQLTHDYVATANKDGADATPSMRTLGTGAAQAAKGNHGHTGHEITLERLGESTYSTVQHWRNNLSSAGVVSGGVITDAGGATINVTAGQGTLRNANSNTATLYFMDWPALNGTAIPSNTVRYVGVEYNAGVPQVTVRTTDNWNYHTDFPLGIVVNEAGSLHIIAGDKHIISDPMTHIMERFEHTYPFARDTKTGGLMLGVSGTRNVAVTAGKVWQKLTEFIVPAFDSSVSGTFDSYHRDGGTGFTKVTGLTQWPNLQYDDGTGTLATLGTNKYATLWFYLEPDDGNIVMVYGRTEHSNAAAAEVESTPNTLPSRVIEGCLLLGRFIFQKSAATPTSISSAFSTVFSNVGVTSHNNLTGLDWPSSGHTGALPVALGGTALAAVGAEATVLTVEAGVPAWKPPAAGGLNYAAMAAAMEWFMAQGTVEASIAITTGSIALKAVKIWFSGI